MHLEKALIGSDDFSKSRSVFIGAAQDLIGQRRCTLGDFKEKGGWWDSSSHKSRSVYFTYCGGMSKSNKFYLDASTGEIFR